MSEFWPRADCRSIFSLILISIHIATEESAKQKNIDSDEFTRNYPLMNISWCQDLRKYCPRKFFEDEAFKVILIDFCDDLNYGFMGVRDAGVDEEKEKSEFKGPKVYTNMQIDHIMEAITNALAENDDGKRDFLKNQLFYCPMKKENRCFWKVYKIFSLMCLDLYYNHYACLYKHLFVHACEANWLNLRKIANITKTTCAEKEVIMMGNDEPSF